MRAFLLLSLLAALSTSAQAPKPTDYRITGTVFDESNRAVEKVRICAFPVDYAQLPQMPCAFSDASGNFVIFAGRPSQYRLLPEKSSAGYQSQRYPFYRNPTLPFLDVTLTERSPSATVSIPLGEKNGFLTGKLTDSATGLPVENVKFFMCHVAEARICWGTFVKSSDGAFSIAAAHVPFTLKISADGYDDWWGPNGVGQNNAMSVAQGTQIELPAMLRRNIATANRALSEAEKNPLKNLPAPVTSSPADRIEFNQYPRHTTLEWQPVEGAAYYMVEIDYCDGRDRNLRECVDPLPFSTTRQWGQSKFRARIMSSISSAASPAVGASGLLTTKGKKGLRLPGESSFI